MRSVTSVWLSGHAQQSVSSSFDGGMGARAWSITTKKFCWGGGSVRVRHEIMPPGIRKSKQNIVRLSRQLYENRQEPTDNWACGNRVYTVMGDSPMKRRLQRWVDRMRECVMLAGWEVRG